MPQRRRKPAFALPLILVITSLACNIQVRPPSADSLATSAAETVAARLTSVATVETPQPLATIPAPLPATETPEVTQSPEPGATWQPCEGAPSSQLHVGDRAMVGLEPPIPNRVRDKPSMDTGKVLGQIQPGEEIEILEGAECSNQMVWWKVKSLEKDLTGWTAEGDKEGYWLVPAE